MSENSEGFFTPDEEARLLSNRNIRAKLVTALVGEGDDVKLPGEKEDKSLLIQLLDGMDREIMTRGRMKAASKEASQFANAAAMVANSLLKHKVGPPANRAVELPSSIPEVEAVPGEKDDGMILLRKEDFMD